MQGRTNITNFPGQARAFSEVNQYSSGQSVCSSAWRHFAAHQFLQARDGQGPHSGFKVFLELSSFRVLRVFIPVFTIFSSLSGGYPLEKHSEARL